MSVYLKNLSAYQGKDSTIDSIYQGVRDVKIKTGFTHIHELHEDTHEKVQQPQAEKVVLINSLISQIK